jgi:hypothetical protein
MTTTFFRPGSWNATCDVCGFEFKAEDMRTRWDGAIICHFDFEERHPSDLIRVPADDPSVPWTSSEPPDTFVDITYLETDE